MDILLWILIAVLVVCCLWPMLAMSKANRRQSENGKADKKAPKVKH